MGWDVGVCFNVLVWRARRSIGLPKWKCGAGRNFVADQRILDPVCFLVARDDLLSFLVQYVVTLRTWNLVCWSIWFGYTDLCGLWFSVHLILRVLLEGKNSCLRFDRRNFHNCKWILAYSSLYKVQGIGNDWSFQLGQNSITSYWVCECNTVELVAVNLSSH